MANDNELPIDVFINLNKKSLAELQEQLKKIGAQESHGEFQFSAGEQRSAAAVGANQGEIVKLLAGFKEMQIQAGYMAAEMRRVGDAAKQAAGQFARAELRDAGFRGPREGGRFTGAEYYVRPDQVAGRRETQRIGGETGTILGLRGSGYDLSERSVFDLARDRARIKTRLDAFRVGAQVQTGFAPDQIQFEGEAIRAKKRVESYFKDVAQHLAAGNANPDLEHLVNTYDATLIPKALQKLSNVAKTDAARAIAADAEALSIGTSREFKVADLTSRNDKRYQQAQRRLAQDIIGGKQLPDGVTDQINPGILAEEIKKSRRAADQGRRRDQADYLRAERESALSQLQSEDPEIRRAGIQAAERARRRGVNAQIYRGYIGGDQVDSDVIDKIRTTDPDIVKKEQDRARAKHYADQARRNAEEARRLYGTGADTSQFQAADLQSKNQELRRAAHARLAKDVLAGRTVDPLAVASIDPGIFNAEADKLKQRQRTDARRAKTQADQDLRERALAQIGSEDPAVRAEGIKASELARRREQDRKIYRGSLAGNAVDPAVLAGIPQDIKDAEDLLRSRKAAKDHLRGLVEAGQKDAGALADAEVYANALLKQDEHNAAARKVLADAAVRGRTLPPGAAANLTSQDYTDATERRKRTENAELNKQRRDRLAELNKQVEAQVGPLEESVRYSQALGKHQERHAAAYRDAAANLASAPFGPITQAQADAASAVHAYDPNLLRRSQLEYQQDQLAQQRAQHSRALNAHFGDPNVSFVDRAKAGLFGNVPGGATEKQPFGADFLRGVFGREGSLSGALGQAVKFSVLYGGLYKIQSLVTGGFAAAASSASQYEDALVALSVATGKSVEANEELASSTSKIATAYGYLPNQGVTAAAQAVGLYGLNDATEFDRNAIAQQSTAVAARIGRLGGQDIGQVQQNVAGLVRSYNLPALGQGQIEDMLSVIQRQTGSQPADLLNAATQLGPISTAAGYDLADTFAMISQAQRLTGQTANAVAGQLSQGLSKAGDPAAKAAFASVGVNVIGTTFKEQVAQLSTLRDTIDPDTFKRVVQSVGRSRSGATFDVLLSQQGQIQDLAGQARNAPAGIGEENFGRSMETLSGQGLKLKGTLAEIGVAIAQSGLLTHLVHLATVLNAMATVVENVVGLYSELPKPLRDAITWGLELALMFRLLTFVTKGQLSARVAGGIGGILAKSPTGGTIVANLARIPGLGRLGGLGGAAGGAAGAGTAAAGAAGLLARTGPGILIGTAAALTYGSIATLNGGLRAREHSKDALDAAKLSDAAAGSAESKREAASRYGEAVKLAQREQEVSLETFMKQGFAPLANQIAELYHYSTAPARQEAAGQDKQRQLTAEADELDKKAAEAASANPAAAFASFSTVDAVSESLGILSTQGLSAKRQLDALNLAFEDMITVSKEGASVAGIIKAGQEQAFTTDVSAAPAKAITKLNERYQSERDQFDLGFWDRLITGVDGFGGFGDYKETAGRHYDEAQAAMDALKDIDIEGLRTDTTALVSDTLATAPHDSRGQVLLSKDNLDTIKGGTRKLIEDKYGTNLPKAVLNDLINGASKEAIDAMSGSVADITTPQGILAYAQNAQKLATQAAQDAGTAAIFTAGENTAEADAAIQALAQQKQNVLEAAQNLPEETESQRTFKANFIADQVSLYDGQIRKAAKSALDGRFADLDAATKLSQSGHALDDEFGRAAEEYLTSVAKLNILDAGRDDIFDAVKAADEYVYGKAKDGVKQSTDFVKAAAAKGAKETASSLLPKGLSATVNGGRPDLSNKNFKSLFDQDVEKRLTTSNNYGWLSNAATNRPDLTLLDAGLTPYTPYSQVYDEKVKDLLTTSNNYGYTSNAATNRPDLTLLDAGLGKRPTPDRPSAATAVAADLEGQLTTPVGIDPNSPEYLQRLAEANENALRIEQFRRESEKNRKLLAIPTNDIAGIDRADIDEAQDLVNDALRRQSDNKAKGVDPLIQESDTALVRKRSLELRQRKEKYAQDQASIANQEYQLSLNVDDPLLDAKSALDQANRNLALAAQGIGDLKSAQLAHRKAQQDVLQAQIDLDAQMRDDYDRTDPVQQAQAELDTLNAKLKITKDPKARRVLSNQIEDKSIDRELAESEQKIKDIDDLESLGKISKATAQAARASEKNRIDAELAGMTSTTTGYRALKDRSTELAKEIKTASEDYSGQFNLRDIKLPTVYEIRRSLGTDRSDISGGSNTTNNVAINGADFARVVQYLQGIFGKQVGRTRSVGARTVG